MAWPRGIEHISLRKLLLGTVMAWLLAVGALVWLVKVPSFDERKRVEIVGEVKEVTTPMVMNQQPVLDFALHDQPVRFRVSSATFKDALKRQVPPELRPGASVRLEVDASNYRQPFSPAPYRVPTVDVDAIRIAQSDVLPLSASRKSDAENRAWARRCVPIFAVCAAFLSAMTVLRLRARRPTA